ncbi:hypothetical protein LEN_4672 [Lysobacter enzymogenes]|uniref:Uncharacterized protein n=1 Tax=Lysobacter enzymogenes TaxID=69 RepID=A0AAU9ASM5_LYSEN|nr:hypothetical protein LEN_4672 [Lysobacter enzymogenes]
MRVMAGSVVRVGKACDAAAVRTVYAAAKKSAGRERAGRSVVGAAVCGTVPRGFIARFATIAQSVRRGARP